MRQGRTRPSHFLRRNSASSPSVEASVAIAVDRHIQADVEIGALCVSQPMEMRSTPVAVTCRDFGWRHSSRDFGDCAIADHRHSRASSSSDMLSSSTASTPASSVRSSWFSVSASILTM